MRAPAFQANASSLRRIDRLCRDLNTLCHVSQKSTAPSKSSVKCLATTEIDTIRSRKRARFSLEPVQAAASYSSSYRASEDESEDIEELKAQLLDSLYGLERGLNASGEIKGEISELILKLEAANPTPEPNKALDMLNGTWTLAYTANSELLALLGLSRLPGVKVGDIIQKIENGRTALNKVILSGPVFSTSFSAKANLEVNSPNRLAVRFQEGQIATPKLIDDLEFPDSLNVFGMHVDLTGLKEALRPVEASMNSTAKQVAAIFDRTPGLSFPIGGPQAGSWLLNTYLDSGLRISRGDGGSVFVMVRE